MGQRHQLFIVSKIRDRYRTLAVVHHQWLYGASATKACWRILQILEHPANKRLIKHELAHAATRPGEWWDDLGDSEDVALFPITLTCLLLGAGIDPRPDSHYQYNAIPLRTATTLAEVDNNDGITVIDISNLDAIRYCFIFLSDPMAPITGIQYYRTYYEEDKPFLPQPANLEAWDLVPIEALRDLWPYEAWDEAEKVSSTACESGGGHDHRIKSLRCLAFEKAIRLAAEQPQLVELLVPIEVIPRFHSDLSEFLQAHPDLVQRPGGLRLLGLAMRHNTILDLSSHPWVTGTQILDLIGENSLEHITSIDLSNNATVDADSIRKILHACPGITELSVLCVEGLPLPSLLDSLQGSHVRTVLHSDLFRYPISRANAAAMSRHFRSATKSSHHIVKQAIVFQNVGDSMSWGLGIPLSDAMLDPADVCEWLRQLLHVVAERRSFFFGGDLAIPLAQSLSVSTTNLWKIRPLPGTLREWFSSRLIAAEDPREVRYDEVQPGEWTVLLLLKGQFGGGTGRQPIFHYVFLTREQDGQLVIADIEKFYRLAVGQQGDGSEAKLATLEEQIRELQVYLSTMRPGNGGQLLTEAEPYDILKLGSGSEFVEVLHKVTSSH